MLKSGLDSVGFDNDVTINYDSRTLVQLLSSSGTRAVFIIERRVLQVQLNSFILSGKVLFEC